MSRFEITLQFDKFSDAKKALKKINAMDKHRTQLSEAGRFYGHVGVVLGDGILDLLSDDQLQRYQASLKDVLEEFLSEEES